MMDIKTKSFVITLIVLVISCKNQTKENEVPNSEQHEIVRSDTQETKIVEGKIDKTKVFDQLEGKWKEIEYPYRTAEFVNSTVKFVEEGTASKTKFEKFEVSEDCQFDNNNIRDLKAGDIILALPETQRCEKLKVSNDTLTLSGFSTNTKEDYHIVYLKLKEEKG